MSLIDILTVLLPNSDIVTVPLDSLGESIPNAVVLSWNKEPGDAVKEDDVIAVVETDKVRFYDSTNLINEIKLHWSIDR